MKETIVALLKGVFSVMVILVFVAGVSGCQKQEGPMEKVGKEADKAVEATKGAVEEAGKKVEKGAEATKEAVEKGVEKTAAAVKETAAKVEEKAKK